MKKLCLIFALFMMFLAVSCGEPVKFEDSQEGQTQTDEPKERGALGGKCFQNGTCNSGLICDEESNTCMKEPEEPTDTGTTEPTDTGTTEPTDTGTTEPTTSLANDANGLPLAQGLQVRAELLLVCVFTHLVERAVINGELAVRLSQKTPCGADFLHDEVADAHDDFMVIGRQDLLYGRLAKRDGYEV